MYIYIYTYNIDLAGLILFAPSSVTVALHLPMLEFSAATPPFVDYVLGTDLMEMCIWTAGSFYVFSDKLDSACLLPVRVQFFLRKHRFPCLLSICQDPSSRVWEKALIGLVS